MESVLLTRDGDIATVTLSNPGKLNALTKGMWREIGAAMRDLSADEALRCVVLRGAGDQAFAAGADISEFARERANAGQARVYGALVHEAIRAVADCRHPTLALIRGACIGGGLEIASQCDLRISGQSSRFGVPIKNLGLVMAYGELEGLLSLVGKAVSLELLLEGRVFDADEALRKGLVTRVVPDDRVEEEAYATARRIADGAPLVARWHKRFVRRLEAQAPPLGEAEMNEGYDCCDTEDYRIGVEAFLAKKKPEFKGR
ncbi:MAG TPA: enoyl-CoA hydratase-related protein [Burkholderiales bacterium]|nr:enoyl-CoA hydratase-related protein [Burkholderiales bacterium]